VDEPTRGVDVGARVEILGALQQLAREGLGVAFSSSDLTEVLSTATRVVVMSRGRIVVDRPSSDVTPDLLAAAASSAPEPERGDRHAS
jgi:rhamnose transport system ATP-binding protein